MPCALDSISLVNSNVFLKIYYAVVIFFSPQCVQSKKCYTWNSCRIAMLFAIILLSVLSAQILGDSYILVEFIQNQGSAFVNLTVGLYTSQPASCFINVGSKNNLMFYVILILLLTVFKRKYYIFCNSLLECLLVLPVSLFSLSTEQLLFFIFDSLLTEASFAACWGKYQ